MQNTKLYKTLIKENKSEFERQYAELYKWCKENGYALKNNKEYFYCEPLGEEQRLAVLRTKREKLLTAFDKWEKAVLRFRESDSSDIMCWFYSLLNLDESAFVNIPDRVKYYM